MDRTDAIAWVLSACALYIRFSQAKTLGALVQAALSVQRVSLANLGRSMQGSSAKHRIKRAWRFLSNQRVEPAVAMHGVVQKLLKKGRGQPLLVSLDWTDVRGLQTLVAAAVVKGRAVPLVWASCRKWVFDKSRNAFEEALLLLLIDMLPAGQEVVLLADRGFGRTSLGGFCQRYKLHYVIRIPKKVTVRFNGQKVRLDRYPVHKGVCELLKGVLYRRDQALEQNLVIRWKKGLPKKRDECWYLMTDLDRPARELSELYAKRMGIEEFFRDLKNRRNGWSLRDTGLDRPDRLDRLILVLVLAYLLLVGLALGAKAKHRMGTWASNNREGELSLFQIGRLEHRPDQHLPLAIIAAVLNASLAEIRKWG